MFTLNELKQLYAFLDRVPTTGLSESGNLQHLARIIEAEIKKQLEPKEEDDG